jgi:hypothetical protein
MNEEQVKQFFSLLPTLPLDFQCMLLLFSINAPLVALK